MKLDRTHWKNMLPIIIAFVEGRTIKHDGRPMTYPGFDDDIETYEISPLSFPDLPEGEEWNNPANLTPEQVGAGWRLITKRETDMRTRSDGEYLNRLGQWEAGAWRFDSRSSIRVPAATPFALPAPIDPKRTAALERIRIIRAELAELEGSL